MPSFCGAFLNATISISWVFSWNFDFSLYWLHFSFPCFRGRRMIIQIWLRTWFCLWLHFQHSITCLWCVSVANEWVRLLENTKICSCNAIGIYCHMTYTETVLDIRGGRSTTDQFSLLWRYFVYTRYIQKGNCLSCRVWHRPHFIQFQKFHFYSLFCFR